MSPRDIEFQVSDCSRCVTINSSRSQDVAVSEQSRFDIAQLQWLEATWHVRIVVELLMQMIPRNQGNALYVQVLHQHHPIRMWLWMSYAPIRDKYWTTYTTWLKGSMG